MPPIPAMLLGEEERIQNLLQEMSEPVTSLVNMLELQRHPDCGLLPHEVLRQLQEASLQIRDRLKDLELLLRLRRTRRAQNRDLATTGGTILLADEKEEAERLWGEVVAELAPDYSLRKAPTAQEALKELSSHPYDLLVSGYRLRGGTGLTLLKKLHDRGIWIPALLIARPGSERIAAMCLEAGFMGYLNDEMLNEPGRLRETISRILREGKRHLQWQASIRKVQTLAMMDGLTSLYNRFFIEYLLEMEMRRSRRYGQPFCLALIDVDHFKEINDRCGHSQGDAVLKELARLLKDHHRSTDHIGRFGGDEFLLILPQTTLDNGLRLCRRMVGMVSRHDFPGDRSNHRLTLSVGLSHWSGGPGLDASRLLHAADHALYQAKDRGRNRVCSLVDRVSDAS